jgi:hypothetical protein
MTSVDHVTGALPGKPKWADLLTYTGSGAKDRDLNDDTRFDQVAALKHPHHHAAQPGGAHGAGDRPEPVARHAGSRECLLLSQIADRRQSRIKSAAFSPISTLGAWVWPRMIVGITDASATRSPSTPRTRSSGSTTLASSLPIRHVPTG